MLCRISRQEELRKLLRHQEHYRQIYYLVKPKGRRIVRRHIKKLNAQIKLLA